MSVKMGRAMHVPAAPPHENKPVRPDRTHLTRGRRNLHFRTGIPVCNLLWVSVTHLMGLGLY